MLHIHTVFHAPTALSLASIRTAITVLEPILNVKEWKRSGSSTIKLSKLPNLLLFWVKYNKVSNPSINPWQTWRKIFKLNSSHLNLPKLISKSFRKSRITIMVKEAWKAKIFSNINKTNKRINRAGFKIKLSSFNRFSKTQEKSSFKISKAFIRRFIMSIYNIVKFSMIKYSNSQKFYKTNHGKTKCYFCSKIWNQLRK